MKNPMRNTSHTEKHYNLYLMLILYIFWKVKLEQCTRVEFTLKISDEKMKKEQQWIPLMNYR